MVTYPVPPIYKSFIKAHTIESSGPPLLEPMLELNEEMINYFQDLFVEGDTLELEQDTRNRDFQFFGPDV